MVNRCARLSRFAIAALIGLALLSACAPAASIRRSLAAAATGSGPQRAEPASVSPTATTVTVAAGDSMSLIAARQGLHLGDLISVNPDVDPDQLYPGQTLNLPPREEPMKAAPALSAAEAAQVEQASQVKPPSLSGDGFLMPVSGRVVSTFGDKADGSRNDGLNIAAAAGTPIRAAENGVVVFTGDRIPGYGRMILVKHAQDFTTAYAHTQTIYVRIGEVVRRGQRIASVGKTGAVGRPQLHFELRQGRAPLDPSGLLEGSRGGQVAASQG